MLFVAWHFMRSICNIMGTNLWRRLQSDSIFRHFLERELFRQREATTEILETETPTRIRTRNVLEGGEPWTVSFQTTI